MPKWSPFLLYVDLSPYCPLVTDGDKIAVFSYKGVYLGIDGAFVGHAYEASAYIQSGIILEEGDMIDFGHGRTAVRSPVTFRVKFYVNTGGLLVYCTG